MVQPSGTSAQDVGPIENPNMPVADPPPPQRQRRRIRWRKWRARFIVLLLLAAAVLVYFRISTNRATQANHIDLGTVTLTAQAIPVESTQTGEITAVLVAAQQRVVAGQRVGTLRVTSTDANGDPKVTTVRLTAPRAGIVIDQPETVGSTLQPGQPFLQLYDPTQLTFTANMSLKELPEIAPTMTAVLRADGIDRNIRARVQRIVPRVQGAQTTSGTNPNALQIVLVPASASEVQGLVPGMRFTGYVNTVSGVPGSTRLVSMGCACAARR
jgi:multidrug resistance efflux pump